MLNSRYSFFLIFWRQLTFAFRFNQKMHPSFKVRDLSNTFRFSAFGQILICSMYINIVIMDHFLTQALKQSVIILPSKNRHYTIQHTSKINNLRSSLNSKETLQNFLYLHKKKTQVVFLFFISSNFHFSLYECPGLCWHSIRKLKMKVAWNEKQKTTSIFFLYKYRKWSISLEFKLEHKSFILEVCMVCIYKW